MSTSFAHYNMLLTVIRYTMRQTLFNNPVLEHVHKDKKSENVEFGTVILQYYCITVESQLFKQT